MVSELQATTTNPVQHLAGTMMIKWPKKWKFANGYTVKGGGWYAAEVTNPNPRAGTITVKWVVGDPAWEGLTIHKYSHTTKHWLIVTTITSTQGVKLIPRCPAPRTCALAR